MKFIIIFLILLSRSFSVDPHTYLPKNAIKYMPLLVKEINTSFNDMPLPGYFGALIEHESCISLTWNSCWSPRSELKTKREEGVGFGQITRAWSKNGRLRFDTIRSLRKRYSSLSELSWDNIRDRPDLQMRAIILLWKSTYDKLGRIKNTRTRIAMTDAAYNGGYGGLRKDIKRCGLTKGCDPTIWFDNVELTCTKSKRKLYGDRSACDINRHHVDDVLNNRLDKYTAVIHF